MRISSIAIGVCFAALSACGAKDEGTGVAPPVAPTVAPTAAPATRAASQEENAIDAAPQAAFAPPPADRTPLVAAPPEPSVAGPANAMEICGEVATLANATRARGERFFAIEGANGVIAAPDWRTLDAASNIELIADGLYDGWCASPARVNEAIGAPFSTAERNDCMATRKTQIRDSFAGAARLQSAMIDIDRDGDEEATYQVFADPARAYAADAADILWNLQPRIFVSATADPETHQALQKTLFAPEASLFLRDGDLYALRAWPDARDRYEVFKVMSAAGRLAQLPLCQLKTEG